MLRKPCMDKNSTSNKDVLQETNLKVDYLYQLFTIVEHIIERERLENERKRKFMRMRDNGRISVTMLNS